MPDLQKILASIAHLAPADQVELARQLVERLQEEGLWPHGRPPARTEPDLVLLFDGGSLGNPGPGYGSYRMTLPDGSEVHRRVRFGDDMTNNEAEYETLIAALEETQRLLGNAVRQMRIQVRGDSQLVVRQIKDEWKARDPRMRVLRDRARKLLESFGTWDIVHVPRKAALRSLGH